MQKVAQKRGLLSKLKEMTDVSGITAEKYFQPELLRIMTELRKIDNNVRSIALGKPVDGGDPGDDLVSMKDLIKSIKSNLNRREYMLAVAELGRFNKKLSDIYKNIVNFNKDVDKIHHQFLFQGLSPENLQYQRLKELHQKWADQQANELIKKASIMDFFHNIGTRRGRALVAWEKRYPEKVKRLKEHSLNMLERSQRTFDNLLITFKIMAEARADRNIDQYMKSAEALIKDYQKYENEFKNYYNSEIRPLIDSAGLFTQVEAVPAEEAKEMGKQEIKAPTDTPKFEAELATPTSEQPPIGQRVPQFPQPTATPEAVAPAAEKEAITPPPTVPSPILQEQKSPVKPPVKPQKKAYVDFIKSLESLSHEDPLILASYIKKYAHQIASKDPETSIQLLNIVRSIKG